MNEYNKQMNDATESAITSGYNNSSDAWRLNALQCIKDTCKKLKEFTMNDVRDKIHSTGFFTHDNRAVGGVVKTAEKNGWIKKTGKSIPSVVGHKTHIQIWSSLLYEN